MNIQYIAELIIASTIPLDDVLKILKDLQKFPLRSHQSIFVITFLNYKKNSEQLDIIHIDEFMNTILPYCMGPNFNLRFYAQLTSYTMINFISNITKFSEYMRKFHFIRDIIKTNLTLYGDVKHNLQIFNSDYRFNHISCDYYLDIRTIFHYIPKITYMSCDEYPLINELLSEYFYDIYKNHKESSFCLYNVEHKWLMKQIIQKSSNDMDQVDKSNSSTVVMTQPAPASSDVIDNFQMKFDPKNLTDLSNSNCEESNQEKNYDMIVVASLITNLPNLGGICRTCEALGIKNITLNSIKIIENKEFKSLSLTSEKWLNITEIKTNNLFNYLIDKRIEGYEIIGAEQTANSKCFSNFKFPRKCLLLLGQEREGIPPDLISLLNHAVEIPQFGMIRSLNVHVTGALFMWEYCKQHIKTNQNSVKLS